MTLENFNGMTGDWLNTADVETGKAFILVDVTSEDNKAVLHLDTPEGVKKWSMNVTNTKKFIEFFSIPKEAIGKGVYFRKVTVTRPSDKQEVEALRIENIA